MNGFGSEFYSISGGDTLNALSAQDVQDIKDTRETAATTARDARNAARATMRNDHANGSPATLPGLNASVDAILEILNAQGFMVDE